MQDIYSYAPTSIEKSEVEFVDHLAPVVERIARILPPDAIWNMYSSDPSETGGQKIFPYCRVDSCLYAAREGAFTLKDCGSQFNNKKYREIYDTAAFHALKAILWVNIGFEGLQNLANDPAAESWTLAIGQNTRKAIMTEGRQRYIESLTYFRDFRTSIGIQNDYFTQYGLEYLLDTIDLV